MRHPCAVGLSLIGLFACDEAARPIENPEGVPVGVGASVPSGSCVGTHGDPPVGIATANWDAATLTFMLGSNYWRLDAQGSVVEHVRERSRMLIDRDEHGTMRSFVYEWDGVATETNSWDQ